VCFFHKYVNRNNGVKTHMTDYTITRTDPANGSFILKPYTANGPAIPSSGALYPGAISANTTLILWGKGEIDYGEPFANDMVHLLENFAGPTAPFYPIQGQLWFDNSVLALHLTTDGLTWDEIAVSGRLSTNFDANGKKLTNIGNATLGADALNRQTADLRYLQLSGGTVTGNIVISGATITGLPLVAIGATDAASKDYVDTQVIAAAGVSSFTDGVTLPRTGAVTLLLTDITNVLGYTPYNGVLNSLGFLTSATGVTTFNGASGAITLTSGDVTTALGFTPISTDTYVSSGAMIGTNLTLYMTVGGPVTIGNVSPAVHDHIPTEIIVNANPSGYDGSRIRDLSINLSGFPQVTEQDVITYFDQDLYKLMGAKRRTLYTVPAGYAVVAVTTGALGTWTIAGNHVSEFETGYALKVDTNGGAGVNITYSVVSSTFGGVNTVITVTSIPGTATVSGTVRALTEALYLDSEYTVEHNDLMVHSNGTKLYASQRGNSYTLMPGASAGRWCGLYTSGSPYAFQLAVDGGANTAVSVPVAQTLYTINGVTTGVSGSWQVSGNHASEFLQYEKLIVSGNTGLGANAMFTGSISGTALTVSVLASGTIRIGETVISADTLPGTTIVSGTYPNYIVSTSQIVSSQPMTGVPMYTVVSAINSGANTVVTVSQPIDAAATGNGTLEVALLFTQLEPIVNAAIVTAGLSATFEADISFMQFLSHTSGTGSQIVYTSGTFDTTMGTNRAVTQTIVNAAAVAANLGYKEVGNPFEYSSLVELDSSVAVGATIECICTVG
jgi:hypothetical protein